MSRALAMVVLSLVALGGCRSGSDRPRAVVVGQASEAETLDPALTTSSEAAQIVAQIYEPLVRQSSGAGHEGEGIVPCLATRWHVSDDGLRWVFELRRGVRFHDDSPFDADAVVFSFERQRDPRHPFFDPGFSYWRTSFSHIVSVRRLGRYQVELRTRRPFAPFLANLAMYPVSIVSPRSFKKGGAAQGRPVGTGPYRVVSWQRGARVVLERFPGYWGGAPRLRRLLFSVVRGAQRRLDGLQSGAIDVIFGVQPQDRPLLRLHPEVRLLPARAANVAYLAINTRRPPFDDVRVRRAINHAVNKSLIVKLGYQGFAHAAQSPIPPGMWGHQASAGGYRYAPKRAKALLRAASFPTSRRFVLRVMSTPRPYLPSPQLVARIIARNLLEVGIRVDVVVEPHRRHLAALRRGQHDLALLGWVTDNGDPDNFLYVLLDADSIASGQNVAFFSDPRVHRILTAARQEMRREVRERLYRQAQALISEQAPWVPLAHAEVAIAARVGLRHVAVDATNTLDFRRQRRP